MELPRAEPLKINVDEKQSVSALWLRPPRARACLVLAHGAGAGMVHPSLESLARDLGECGIATLRYQFPFMEHGGKRPDAPGVAHATVRAAVSTALAVSSDIPLFAGGRSFGGRMTSQAQAASPLPGVKGLVFFGFPLHPAGLPRASAASTSSTCTSQCCSFREPAMPSATSDTFSPSAPSSAAGLP